MLVYSCPQVCNFESGMCGWTGSSGSNWQIGRTPGGPVVDFSQGTPTGQYLWTNETFFTQRQSVTSPTFLSAGSQCTFTGEYYVTGDSKSKSTVKVKPAKIIY